MKICSKWYRAFWIQRSLFQVHSPVVQHRTQLQNWSASNSHFSFRPERPTVVSTQSLTELTQYSLFYFFFSFFFLFFFFWQTAEVWNFRFCFRNNQGCPHPLPSKNVLVCAARRSPKQPGLSSSHSPPGGRINSVFEAGEQRTDLSRHCEDVIKRQFSNVARATFINHFTRARAAREAPALGAGWVHAPGDEVFTELFCSGSCLLGGLPVLPEPPETTTVTSSVNPSKQHQLGNQGKGLEPPTPNPLGKSMWRKIRASVQRPGHRAWSICQALWVRRHAARPGLGDR